MNSSDPEKATRALALDSMEAAGVVVIVGRPNVGKSTLYNRLTRRRDALVANEAGLTRDRHYGFTTWDGVTFQLVDTGGFEFSADDDILTEIRVQTDVAIEEADIVLFVGDGREGPTNSDQELVSRLRRAGKAILYAINKVDGPKVQAALAEFYRIGATDLLPISAEHGLGIDDLIDRILGRLPTQKANDDPSSNDSEAESVPTVSLALVGRPNAGKSALLNRLTGQKRAIVSDIPGTTRDPINMHIETDRGPIVLVDTAGIRRRRRAAPYMEYIAMIQAQRNIRIASIVGLVIDADAGVTLQDAKLADLAMEAGRGLVLILNKSDLLTRTRREEIKADLTRKLHFVDFSPRVFLSALSGNNVAALWPLIWKTERQWNRRISTSELNRFFRKIIEEHHAPAYRGHPIRFYYITQAQARPPTFIVSTNSPKGIPDSYRRYLINQIRQNFGFEGSAIRIFFRNRSEKETK